MVSGVNEKYEEGMSESAQYQPSMALPEQFDWRNPNWEKWIRRWERYRLASNLIKKPSEYQVNMLIYVLGVEADELLDRLGLAEEERDNYEFVVEKLARHFKGKTNLVFERSRFFANSQQVREPVEEFVNDLHSLAKNCKFEGLKEELIMHKIIQGMQNTQLSEALQVKSDLTLKEVEMRVKQAETVKNQQEAIRGLSSGANADVAYRDRRRDELRGRSCQRCGNAHKDPSCPALKYQCNICKQIGHFAKVCKTKQGRVREIVADDEENASEEEYRLNSINVSNVSREKPDVEVDVSGRTLAFKIDTGADVTIIGGSLYHSLFGRSFPLERTDLRLFGAGRHPLRLLGKFNATLSIKGGRKIREMIYVMKDEQYPLLGRPAIEAFGLIKWICSLEHGKIPEMCQPLLKGIGKMKAPKYRIEIDREAKPFAIKTPRRIPLHLKEKSKQELEKLERQGIMSNIETPTEWVAGMVVVPKSNGDVRICVDYSQLNQAVKRERSMIPSVDPVDPDQLVSLWPGLMAFRDTDNRKKEEDLTRDTERGS